MSRPQAAASGTHRKQGSGWDQLLLLIPKVIFALQLAVSLAGFALIVALRASDWADLSVEIPFFATVQILAMLANGLVATLILSRHPRHAVGWLLLAWGTTMLLQLLAEELRLLADGEIIRAAAPLVTLLLWIGGWIWTLQFLLPVLFLPLYFPTGRLLSPRWRIVAAAAVLVLAGFAVSAAIQPADFVDVSTGQDPAIPGREAIAGVLEKVLPVVFIPTAVLAMIHLLLRFRRAGPVEKAQMKWLGYPLLVILFWWFGVRLLLGGIAPEIEAKIDAFVAGWDFGLMIFGIPLAIGIAILRYRLFDIDLIIRRTLQYALLTSILGLVYFMLVIAFQGMFASAGTAQSEIGLVFSTLAIAGLFNPLRIRIQRAIDRRFYRQKYQAEEALAQFGAAARDEIDLEQLNAALLQVIQETMQPDSINLWLRSDDA